MKAGVLFHLLVIVSFKLVKDGRMVNVAFNKLLVTRINVLQC